jgi:hypothetical protein
VRLRPLTEAECYARCYGARREEAVSIVWVEPAEREPDADERDAARGMDAADGREVA